MKYNPKEPATIHNQVPLARWPFKKGRRVIYIDGTTIASGVVTFYQPATHGSYLVTKGHPTVTLKGGHVASVEDTRYPSKRGRVELVRKIICRYLDQAERLEADARQLRATAAALTVKEKK